jgi:hypothetical protein
MTLPTFEMTFEDEAALLREVAENLGKGRTFLPDAEGIDAQEACELILRHPETGQGLRLSAQAVWVQADGAGGGVGFEVTDLDVDRLRSFVETGEGDPDLALPPGVVAIDETEGVRSSPPASRGDDRDGRHVHERVRHLSIREQVSWARSGSLTERIALERCHGPSAWENLLQNPQLTAPEVSRIAKKGNVPQPLLNVICSNSAWLTSPEVQRALLSNPRLGGTQLTKVLRALSRADLQRVPVQSAYRFAVRDAAKKMLKGQ